MLWLIYLPFVELHLVHTLYSLCNNIWICSFYFERLVWKNEISNLKQLKLKVHFVIPKNFAVFQIKFPFLLNN